MLHIIRKMIQESASGCAGIRIFKFFLPNLCIPKKLQELFFSSSDSLLLNFVHPSPIIQ